VATFTRLKSGSWRVQVRRKGKYLNNTFLRRKDAEEWALETERRMTEAPFSHPMSARAGYLGALLLRCVQSFF
jgi:hypothetical protein